MLSLILAVSLAAPLAPLAPVERRRPVPFREALALAAQQSPDLAIARAQAQVAAAAKSKALTAWQPDLLASLQYDHTSAPAVLNYGQIATAFGITTATNIEPLTIIGPDSLYGTVQLTQPFFSPQGLFLLAPAKAGAEAAALSGDESREQVLLSAARTYLTLVGVAQLKAAAQDALEVAQRREQDAGRQLEAGTGTQVALLRAKSETARAQSQLAQLDGQRDALLSLLEAVTGTAVQPDLSEPEPVLPEPANEALSPWEGAFAVKSARRAVEAADGTLTYDKFAWLPTVAGVAKGSYNSNTGFTGRNYYYDLIVQASLPIYDHGVRHAQLAEDRGKRAQAVAQLESSLAHGRATWVAARANLQAARAVLAQSEAQAALAALAQHELESSAKAGVATNLELSDADAQRFLADSQLAQSRVTVLIRKAEVAAAEGLLNRDLVGGE